MRTGKKYSALSDRCPGWKETGKAVAGSETRMMDRRKRKGEANSPIALFRSPIRFPCFYSAKPINLAMNTEHASVLCFSVCSTQKSEHFPFSLGKGDGRW